MKRLSNRLTRYFDLQEMSLLETFVDDVKKILSVKRGTYLGDPEFGTDIAKLAFEPKDDETISEAKADIKSAMQKYLSISVAYNIEGYFVIENGAHVMVINVIAEIQGRKVEVGGFFGTETFSVFSNIDDDELLL